MRILKLIACFFFISAFNLSAQQKEGNSEENKTIEINNDNGKLSITLTNGIITEFIINNSPVSTDRYDNYQEIVDEFADDGTTEFVPTPPVPPTPSLVNDKRSDKLSYMIIGYLMDEDIINSATKYKVELKKKVMKVDGNKMSDSVRNKCLEFFEEIYGHPLSEESKINIKQTKKSTSVSVKILN